MNETPATGRLSDWMEDAHAARVPDGVADVLAEMGGLEGVGRDCLHLSPRTDLYEDDEIRSIRSRNSSAATVPSAMVISSRSIGEARL